MIAWWLYIVYVCVCFTERGNEVQDERITDVYVTKLFLKDKATYSYLYFFCGTPPPPIEEVGVCWRGQAFASFIFLIS